MLHLREKDKPWQEGKLAEVVKDIKPYEQIYNQSVMVALIESSYIQTLIKFNTNRRSAYPAFLEKMLQDKNSDSMNTNPSKKNSLYIATVKDFKMNIVQRSMVKEACCRQIIKFFENESRNLSQSSQAAQKSKSKKTKDKKGGEDEEGEGAQRKHLKQDRVRLEDEDDKVDFVKLVKPLLLTMQSDNQELAAMAAIALVNLCNYSEDIKEIFF